MDTAEASAKHLTAEQLDQLFVNTISTLSMDAVQQANSGSSPIRWSMLPNSNYTNKRMRA